MAPLIRARAAATHPRNVLHNLRYEYKFLNCPRARPSAPAGVISRFLRRYFSPIISDGKMRIPGRRLLDVLKNSLTRPLAVPSDHNKLHLFYCGAWTAAVRRRYYAKHDGKLNCWHIFTSAAMETASSYTGRIDMDVSAVELKPITQGKLRAAAMNLFL